MINFVKLEFFFFIFSILVIIRNIFRAYIEIKKERPKPMKLTAKELLLVGVSFSYIITYLYH